MAKPKADRGSIATAPAAAVKEVDHMAPYHTLLLSPASKGEPKTVPVNINGTEPDGTPFSFSRIYMRGKKQYNVPECALEALRNGIETSYELKQKSVSEVADGEDGFTVTTEQYPSYPFVILETYAEKIEVPAEVKK
jgi:hypothetical protein